MLLCGLYDSRLLTLTNVCNELMGSRVVSVRYRIGLKHMYVLLKSAILRGDFSQPPNLRGGYIYRRHVKGGHP